MKKRFEKTAQVDLIPMIDVVFQLILFFLVSTTFALMPAISVTLPSSETAEGVQVKSLTITAESNGNLWLNEKQMTLVEIENALTQWDMAEEERKEFPVRIEADELVTNGTIVKIFDVLRRSGFVSVNLSTTSE
ncbi:MAG: biopolymer transporter ExbD [Spirochaetaceae bacterium]|nr:biopolymer transporter ExbD [Spirochaetaceae bacterium]